mmetsp:Transcript_22256/g.63859  ORF Transcript_22256/g.63859 Transcript_22256/m.63859 type:complete len:324 (+) Transcript_22256:66-1037(+)
MQSLLRRRREHQELVLRSLLDHRRRHLPVLGAAAALELLPEDPARPHDLRHGPAAHPRRERARSVVRLQVLRAPGDGAADVVVRVRGEDLVAEGLLHIGQGHRCGLAEAEESPGSGDRGRVPRGTRPRRLRWGRPLVHEHAIGEVVAAASRSLREAEAHLEHPLVLPGRQPAAVRVRLAGDGHHIEVARVRPVPLQPSRAREGRPARGARRTAEDAPRVLVEVLAHLAAASGAVRGQEDGKAEVLVCCVWASGCCCWGRIARDVHHDVLLALLLVALACKAELQCAVLATKVRGGGKLLQPNRSKRHAGLSPPKVLAQQPWER